MYELLTILAQAPNAPAPRAPGGMSFVFPAALLAMIVFMILTSRSQRKREQRQKDEMHAGLTKNDRVLTVGGIIGTVIGVKENEVIVKVDESTNTKMTFTKAAIQRVLSNEPDAARPK